MVLPCKCYVSRLWITPALSQPCRATESRSGIMVIVPEPPLKRNQKKLSVCKVIIRSHGSVLEGGMFACHTTAHVKVHAGAQLAARPKPTKSRPNPCRSPSGTFGKWKLCVSSAAGPLERDKEPRQELRDGDSCIDDHLHFLFYLLAYHTPRSYNLS